MLEKLLQDVLIFLQSNPAIAVALACLAAALFYFKPKAMFKLLAFVIFLVAALYILTLLVDTVTTGSEQKSGMIYNSREAMGD